MANQLTVPTLKTLLKETGVKVSCYRTKKLIIAKYKEEFLVSIPSRMSKSNFLQKERGVVMPGKVSFGKKEKLGMNERSLKALDALEKTLEGKLEQK